MVTPSPSLDVLKIYEEKEQIFFPFVWMFKIKQGEEMRDEMVILIDNCDPLLLILKKQL